MGSGARRRRKPPAGIAGYQRPLVSALLLSGSVGLIGRYVRVGATHRDDLRPASADGAPEGIDEAGPDPGDSGQSVAVRMD